MIYKEINYTINFKTAWSQLLQGEQYRKTSGGLKLPWRVSDVPSGSPWLLKVRWKESQSKKGVSKKSVCHRRLCNDLLDALHGVSLGVPKVNSWIISNLFFWSFKKLRKNNIGASRACLQDTHKIKGLGREDQRRNRSGICLAYPCLAALGQSSWLPLYQMDKEQKATPRTTDPCLRMELKQWQI